MLRKTARNLAILVSLTTVSGPQTVVSQIFTRVEAMHAVAPSAGCTTGNCTPNQFTFGHYREHWRQWPDETRGIGTLSPFAGPRRETPATSLPDPRDETSPSPRQRGTAGGATTAQPAPSQPSTSVPPAAQPSPSAGPPSATTPRPQSDLPSLPDDMGAPESAEADGGFFPLPDSPADQTDALPDSLGPGLDTEPLPNDFESDLPSGFEDAPSEDPADVFDLDDFGQSTDPRQRRYLVGSSRALRRATPYDSYDARTAAAWPTRQVAAYEYEDSNEDTDMLTPVRTAEHRTQAVAAGTSPRALSAAQQQATEAGRHNPLRRTSTGPSNGQVQPTRVAPEAPALNQRATRPQRRQAARVPSVPPRAFRTVAPPAPDWRAVRDWPESFPAEAVEEASFQGSGLHHPTEPLPLTENDFQPAFNAKMVVVDADPMDATTQHRSASERHESTDTRTASSRRNPLR